MKRHAANGDVHELCKIICARVIDEVFTGCEHAFTEHTSPPAPVCLEVKLGIAETGGKAADGMEVT